MRVASLKPYLTEFVSSLGAREFLAGVSDACLSLEWPSRELPVISRPHPVMSHDGKNEAGGELFSGEVEALLTDDRLDLDALIAADPEVILTTCHRAFYALPEEEQSLRLKELEQSLSARFPHEVRVKSFNPLRLEDFYELYLGVGKALGMAERGRDLAQRAKSQFLDWCDNFYDRTRNKKVTFLAGTAPFRLGGFWLPDMIHMCSCLAQEPNPGFPPRQISWDEIISYRPDVILVAPEGFSLEESMRTFKTLEKLPGWEDVPAIRRGEVFFTDGTEHFFRPGPGLIDSMGILVSAIAGIDSGYITKRDSFHRLRWLEMQRHRF